MNHRAICILPVVPVRATASDKSEMVTQLLFGDTLEIIELSENKKWAFIRIDYDIYEGWVDTKMILKGNVEEDGNNFHFTPNNCIVIDLNTNLPLNLPIGCKLPKPVNGVFEISDRSYEINAELIQSIDNSKEKVAELALLYLNTPYLWGGKSNWGIDCSGFSQQIFRMIGIKLPRDAYQQAEIGREVTNPECGDLAFFHNESGKIIHVGIMLSENQIIHAHAWLRIDFIKESKIWNDTFNVFTHTLTCYRRYF